MSKSRPALAPHKLRYLLWGAHNLDSSTPLNVAATAVDAIDTTDADGADSTFAISIPDGAAGGEGTVIISLDNSETTGTTAADVSTIGIGTSGRSIAQIAVHIQNAINGVTDSTVTYATSGAGTNAKASGILGITAAQGSTTNQITLTSTAIVPEDGNLGVLADISGNDVVDVTSFTGGVTSRSWTSSGHPLNEADSGAVILVNTAFGGTDGKVMTLPSAKKGLYFKFVWGVNDGTGNASVDIKTASTAELIKGTVLAFDNGNGDFTHAIAHGQMNGTNHDEIQIEDDILAGSYLELVSDGDHWYIANSKIYTTEADTDTMITQN